MNWNSMLLCGWQGQCKLLTNKTTNGAESHNGLREQARFHQSTVNPVGSGLAREEVGRAKKKCMGLYGCNALVR